MEPVTIIGKYLIGTVTKKVLYTRFDQSWIRF